MCKFWREKKNLLSPSFTFFFQTFHKGAFLKLKYNFRQRKRDKIRRRLRFLLSLSRWLIISRMYCRRRSVRVTLSDEFTEQSLPAVRVPREIGYTCCASIEVHITIARGCRKRKRQNLFKFARIYIFFLPPLFLLHLILLLLNLGHFFSIFSPLSILDYRRRSEFRLPAYDGVRWRPVSFPDDSVRLNRKHRLTELTGMNLAENHSWFFFFMHLYIFLFFLISFVVALMKKKKIRRIRRRWRRWRREFDIIPLTRC